VQYQNNFHRLPAIGISEEEWDFGRVKQGENPVHTFMVSNQGTGELNINRVRASCGCVQTTISDTLLSPGESAELKALFSTSDYEGKLEKIIYINSNDPDIPEKRIKVKIEIEHRFKPKIHVTGIEQSVGVLSQGDVVNLNVIVENQGDAELIIDKIDTYQHIILNNSLPMKILPKEKSEIKLTYHSTEHLLGEVREAVMVYCNDPLTPSFSIRISGYIKEKEPDKISITPAKVVYHLGPDSENDLLQKLVIRNFGIEGAKIISVESSADYIISLGNEYQLEPEKTLNLPIALQKNIAVNEIGREDKEEYLFLTFAIPIKINE